MATLVVPVSQPQTTNVPQPNDNRFSVARTQGIAIDVHTALFADPAVPRARWVLCGRRLFFFGDTLVQGRIDFEVESSSYYFAVQLVNVSHVQIGHASQSREGVRPEEAEGMGTGDDRDGSSAGLDARVFLWFCGHPVPFHAALQAGDVLVTSMQQQEAGAVASFAAIRNGKWLPLGKLKLDGGNGRRHYFPSISCSTFQHVMLPSEDELQRLMPAGVDMGRNTKFFDVVTSLQERVNKERLAVLAVELQRSLEIVVGLAEGILPQPVIFNDVARDVGLLKYVVGCVPFHRAACVFPMAPSAADAGRLNELLAPQATRVQAAGGPGATVTIEAASVLEACCRAGNYAALQRLLACQYFDDLTGRRSALYAAAAASIRAHSEGCLRELLELAQRSMENAMNKKDSDFFAILGATAALFQPPEETTDGKLHPPLVAVAVRNMFGGWFKLSALKMFLRLSDEEIQWAYDDSARFGAAEYATVFNNSQRFDSIDRSRAARLAKAHGHELFDNEFHSYQSESRTSHVAHFRLGENCNAPMIHHNCDDASAPRYRIDNDHDNYDYGEDDDTKYGRQRPSTVTLYQGSVYELTCRIANALRLGSRLDIEALELHVPESKVGQQLSLEEPFAPVEPLMSRLRQSRETGDVTIVVQLRKDSRLAMRRWAVMNGLDQWQ